MKTFNGVGNWTTVLPFLCASNGEIIWHLDVRRQKRVSRQLKGFHSAEAPKLLYKQDSTPGRRIFLLQLQQPNRYQRIE
jgi:type I site-specific restriction endonuclease